MKLKSVPKIPGLNKSWMFILCSLLSIKNIAQTFPPTSNCVSKDLELVGSSLPGSDACSSCTLGSTVTRTLYLSINNKTGSTRTSFAFWGTLEIYNADGTKDVINSRPISGCVNNLIKNSVTTLPYGNLTYTCGQSLKLTNLYLAWTDASANSTCASLLGSPSTINPKCGTLPSLQILAGVDANFTVNDPTCTTTGSIVASPFGGKSPYKIQIGSVINSGVTTSTTFSNLTAGTYTITITDANGCVSTRTRTLNAPNSVTAPNATVTQPTCTVATGIVNVTNPLSDITYTLSQSNVLKYTAVNGVFSNVAEGIYSFTATKGSCTANSSITINPQPTTPVAPVSGGNKTECETAPIQTLTATATGVGVSWYNEAVGGSVVANPILNSTGSVTYYAQSFNGSCNSLNRTPVTLTINSTPSAPVSGGNKTECETNPIQTLTATATGVGITWYDASNEGIVVANPILNSIGTVTYYAQSFNGSCNSLSRTPVTLTLNAKPATPSICVTQPSLCGPSTGSVKFNSPLGSQYSYSIDNGNNWQTGIEINNLAAGSVNGISVKDNNGCISNSIDCSNSDCSSTSSRISNTFLEKAIFGNDSKKIKQIISNKIAEDNNAVIQVYPNPFNEQVTFFITLPKAGNGRLEIYNSIGQKISAGFQGLLSQGGNKINLKIPLQHDANIYYKFITKENEFTGKMIQLKK